MMMTRISIERTSSASLLALAFALGGCGTHGSTNGQDAGGVGGQSTPHATGGATGSGGEVAAGSGGAMGTGGASPAGSGGGVVDAGSATATGGATAAGGLDATGGASAAAGTGGARLDAGSDGSAAGNGGPGGAAAAPGSGGTNDAGLAGGGDAGPAPPFTGPTIDGTVTVTRTTTMGRLVPGFAGFSFEKSHLTDGFFTGTNAPLIAMFKLLGPGVVRIGANDVDKSIWQPSATPLQGGMTTPNVGTADVDALAAFLAATNWKVIYGLNLKTSTPTAAVPEAVYVSAKLGTSLASFEIGNEISFYSGGIGVIQPLWQTFAVAIQAALPGVALAGPGVYGDINFTSTFTAGEASRIVQLTFHYYRAAASTNPLLSQLLATDPAVVSQSQGLATIVSSNKIRDGFRWGEMNSYSGHGAAGVSDVFGSALWGIDFMLTTAEYGAVGVNFHGGGQNMDGNVCSNGVASCTKPFRYSPIDEVDSQVTAAAPLFYGMLLVSQAGTGSMLATKASAGSLNFTAYSIAPGDGSTNLVLVNKDATTGVNASVDVGAPVTTASAVYLRAPSLTATTGVTFAGAGVTPGGVWSPHPPYDLPVKGNVITVVLPPASATLVRAK